MAAIWGLTALLPREIWKTVIIRAGWQASKAFLPRCLEDFKSILIVLILVRMEDEDIVEVNIILWSGHYNCWNGETWFQLVWLFYFTDTGITQSFKIYTYTNIFPHYRLSNYCLMKKETMVAKLSMLIPIDTVHSDFQYDLQRT